MFHDFCIIFGVLRQLSPLLRHYTELHPSSVRQARKKERANSVPDSLSVHLCLPALHGGQKREGKRKRGERLEKRERREER